MIGKNASGKCDRGGCGGREEFTAQEAKGRREKAQKGQRTQKNAEGRHASLRELTPSLPTVRSPPWKESPVRKFRGEMRDGILQHGTSRFPDARPGFRVVEPPMRSSLRNPRRFRPDFSLCLFCISQCIKKSRQQGGGLKLREHFHGLGTSLFPHK